MEMCQSRLFGVSADVLENFSRMSRTEQKQSTFNQPRSDLTPSEHYFCLEFSFMDLKLWTTTSTTVVQSSYNPRIGVSGPESKPPAPVYPTSIEQITCDYTKLLIHLFMLPCGPFSWCAPTGKPGIPIPFHRHHPVTSTIPGNHLLPTSHGCPGLCDIHSLRAMGEHSLPMLCLQVCSGTRLVRVCRHYADPA